VRRQTIGTFISCAGLILMCCLSGLVGSLADPPGDTAGMTLPSAEQKLQLQLTALGIALAGLFVTWLGWSIRRSARVETTAVVPERAPDPTWQSLRWRRTLMVGAAVAMIATVVNGLGRFASWAPHDLRVREGELGIALVSGWLLAAAAAWATYVYLPPREP
jgi:hypothetical protein